MVVEVKLFAIARQRVGAAAVKLELPPGARVQDLRAALAAQYPAIADGLAQMRFAVNNEYAADSAVIPAAAEVACIPPVSGG
jgi:molybdopterin synthase sulfur carrier subunit